MPFNGQGEFTVNTTAVRDQLDSSVAPLGDGGFVVTWTSTGQDFDGSDGVFGQRYDATGTRVGSEFSLSNPGSATVGFVNTQASTSVALLNDGGFAASWSSTFSDSDIAGRVFNADGTSRTVSNFAATGVFGANSTGIQDQSATAALAGGGYVVVWRDAFTDDIIAQLYSASGAALGYNTRINFDTSGIYEQPSVAALPNGGFVVTYNSAGANGDVYGWMFDANGNRGNPLSETTSLTALDTTVTSGAQSASSVAVLPNANVVVVWQSNAGDGGDIYARIFNATTGAPVSTLGNSSEFVVNSGTAQPGTQTKPVVVALSDGSFVVGWQSAGNAAQGDSGFDLYARHYTAAGAADNVFRLNATTLNDQVDLALAAQKDGGFVATWTNATASDKNIVGQRFLLAAPDTTPPAQPSAPDLDAASDSGASNTDNITNLTTLTFHGGNGAAEANSTVKIYATAVSSGGTGPDVLKGSATADANGAWSFTSTFDPGLYDIKVTATDAANNTSLASAALRVTIDTTPTQAPGAPDLAAASDSGISSVDNITNINKPTFAGTAFANHTVQVFADGNLVGTTTADNAGAWTLTLANALADKTWQITAKTVDVAGNVSPASSLLSITVDTTAPAAPGAPDLTAASDTGVSNTDNFTADTTPTMTGTGAVANGQVQVFSDGTLLGTTTADGGGAWTFTPATPLATGQRSITAKALDTAGNVSAASAGLTITIDGPPSVPAKPDMQALSDTGTSATDDLTNDSTPTLTGTGAGAYNTVEVFSDGASIGFTSSDASGAWSFTPGTAMSDGPHAITARAISPGGSTSGFSAALNITIDTVAPAAPGAPDLAATSDTGVSNTDNITDDNTPTFTGTGALANGTVNILADGAKLGTVTADAGGAWSFTTGTIADGAHAITAQALDAAGNASVNSAALTVTIDTGIATPGVPDLDAASDTGVSSTDNLTNDATPSFTGLAEANSSVEIFIDGVSRGTTSANGAGVWAFTSATLGQGAHTIAVRATDLAAHVSGLSPALSFTIDTQPPAAPGAPDLDAGSDDGISSTDNLTTDTTPTFKGAGAPANGTVELFASGTLLGSTTADASGNWTFTASPMALGLWAITAKSVDTAGNASVSSSPLQVTITDGRDPGGFGGTVPYPQLAASSDNGASNDLLTNDTTPTFTGFATATLVHIFVDGVEVGTASVPSGFGSWQFTPTLSEGAHAIQYQYGSNPISLPTHVMIDATPPAATPSAPDLAAASDSGRSNSDNYTDDTTPTFSGTGGVPFGSVEIREDGAAVATTIADATGAWTFTPGTAWTDGVHTVTAAVLDEAGNAVVSSPLSVTIDTTTPGAPFFSFVQDDTGFLGDVVTSDTTPQIHGGAEANATIRVFINGAFAGTTVAAPNGAFSFDVGAPLTDGRYSITLQQVDPAGHVGPVSTATTLVIDTTPATTVPTVKLAAGSDTGISHSDGVTTDVAPTLTGTGEPNSVVFIYLDGGSQPFRGAFAQTDASGLWSWSFNQSERLPDGPHTVTVQAADLARNLGPMSAPLTFSVDTQAPDGILWAGINALSTFNPVNTTEDHTPTLNFVGPLDDVSLQVFADGVLLGTTPMINALSWSFTPVVPLASGDYTITVLATDAAGNTDPGRWELFNEPVTITILDSAVVTSSGGHAIATEQTPIVIDNALTVTNVVTTPPSGALLAFSHSSFAVSDVGSTLAATPATPDPGAGTPTSGTVSITENFHPGQDVLGFTDQNGITGSYDGASGVLTLTGAASLDDYQTALRSVTYLNTSDSPDTLVRTISFMLSDGTAASTVATKTLGLTAVNDAPVAQDGAASGAEDTVITGTLAATDTDSPKVVYAVATQAAHGAVTVNADGSFSYTPDTDFNGTDSFTFKANDGALDSDPATVTLSVAAVNDAPVIGGDLAVKVAEGGSVVLTGADLTATDPDNTDAQLIFTVTGTTHGVVQLDGSDTASFTKADILAGKVSFVHDGSEADGGFAVALSDGTAASITASVAAVVDPHLNDAPVLGGDLAITVAEGGSVVLTSTDLTASDPDNTDAQLVFTVTGTAHGKVQLDGADTTSFTKADILAGHVSFLHDGGEADGGFSVSLSDGAASGGTATVSATVDPHVNDAPVVGDITLPSIQVNSGAHLITAVQLLANASDAEGDALHVTDLHIDKGLGALADNHDGTWTYTPKINDDTEVSFQFTVSDGQASSDGHAKLDITAVQSAPALGTSGDDSFTAVTGNATYVGGLGVDTITFDFKLTDATITFSDNQITIDGPSSHTVLSGIEVFKFTDGTVNDNDGNPLVDDLFYYANNHDVWLAGADADAHFAAYGWKEGRDPNAFFDIKGYLAHNPDVAAAGINPLTHYDQFGWKEGRDPSAIFDTKDFLAANPDVKAAGVGPLAQFLLWGAQEGRHAVNDGHWG